MFYYLEGNISIIERNIAVVDCGGIGFRCNITSYTRNSLQEGKRARLFTYCNIREDGCDIFGFASIAEKSCFEMLISVSGVGPKAALSILSVNAPNDLAIAVIAGNEKALTAAPGIGKKIAQRVILELKDKMSKEPISTGNSSLSDAISAVYVKSAKAQDAAAALTVLGYNQTAISVALKGLDIENMTLEEIVRSALKRMVI